MHDEAKPEFVREMRAAEWIVRKLERSTAADPAALAEAVRLGIMFPDGTVNRNHRAVQEPHSRSVRSSSVTTKASL